jgi:hypothetical protein
MSRLHCRLKHSNRFNFTLARYAITTTKTNDFSVFNMHSLNNGYLFSAKLETALPTEAQQPLSLHPGGM